MRFTHTLFLMIRDAANSIRWCFRITCHLETLLIVKSKEPHIVPHGINAVESMHHMLPFTPCWQECSQADELFILPVNTIVAAAGAKSLQSCPTLCDPIDGSPSGSPVPGILQARTLEWVAISFSEFVLLGSAFLTLSNFSYKNYFAPYITISTKFYGKYWY